MKHTALAILLAAAMLAAQVQAQVGLDPPPTPPAAPDYAYLQTTCTVANDTLTVEWDPLPGEGVVYHAYFTRDGRTRGNGYSGPLTRFTVSGVWLRTYATRDVNGEPAPPFHKAVVTGYTSSDRQFRAGHGSCMFETPRRPLQPRPIMPVSCRWEHRFNAFPGGSGVLRLSSRKAGARVSILAFDRTSGNALHVQDLDNDRVLTDSIVTLATANTIHRYAIAGTATGDHTLAVVHGEHVDGMRAVTTTLARQSGGMTQIVPADVVEHCAPVAQGQ